MCHRTGAMGLLPDTQNCGLRMRLECRERFPHHRGLAIPTCITARASRTLSLSCVCSVSRTAQPCLEKRVGVGVLIGWCLVYWFSGGVYSVFFSGLWVCVFSFGGGLLGICWVLFCFWPCPFAPWLRWFSCLLFYRCGGLCWRFHLLLFSVCFPSGFVGTLLVCVFVSLLGSCTSGIQCFGGCSCSCFSHSVFLFVLWKLCWPVSSSVFSCIPSFFLVSILVVFHPVGVFFTCPYQWLLLSFLCIFYFGSDFPFGLVFGSFRVSGVDLKCLFVSSALCFHPFFVPTSLTFDVWLFWVCL